MCSAKISEEKGVADQFQKSIEAAKEEMVTTSSALKIDFDRSILTKEGEVRSDCKTLRLCISAYLRLHDTANTGLTYPNHIHIQPNLTNTIHHPSLPFAEFD